MHRPSRRPATRTLLTAATAAVLACEAVGAAEVWIGHLAYAEVRGEVQEKP